MKTFTLLGALALFVSSVVAQSPIPTEQQQLQALMKEVQMQQTRLAENQAKIDEKLATLGEAIRVAKIYASRGGR